MQAPNRPVPGKNTTPSVTEAIPAVTLRRTSPYLKVIATDFDGTLAENGVVSADVWDALYQAKRGGLVLVLVTGRCLDSFLIRAPFTDLFDAIVAEDGAVLYFPKRDEVLLPFGHVAPSIVRRLKDNGVPLEEGVAIVATRTPHDEIVLRVLHEVGGGVSVEYNRGAVMVKPPGATKGTGLTAALRELGYSLHNVVALGDAENDRSLFEVAEVSIAVANAHPEIYRLADIGLTCPDGAGIQQFFEQLEAGTLPPRRARSERALYMGNDQDGLPVHLDPFSLIEHNLAIVGNSSSGKSWLAGLLAEDLLKQDYQLCVIDPEGDYRGLQFYPHTLVLGGADSTMPAISDVLHFADKSRISIVLDVSCMQGQERIDYVLQVLAGLRDLRARRGRPQWILIDEIQNLCDTDDDALAQMLAAMMETQGGLGFVSYRPSDMASRLLTLVNLWCFKRLNHPGDIATILKHIEGDLDKEALGTTLPHLQAKQVYLWNESLPSAYQSEIVSLPSDARKTAHRRHLYKYLHAPLPPDKQFYFTDSGGRLIGYAAGNLWEFCEGIRSIPIESFSFHLRRGDFEKWTKGVLHDGELAEQLRKVARRQQQGLEDEALRATLMDVAWHRYEALEGLG